MIFNPVVTGATVAALFLKIQSYQSTTEIAWQILKAQFVIWVGFENNKLD